MLAQTPPLGWNSWNTFGANISEDLVLETALRIRPVKVG
jgi:alpha-galactosidase